MDGAADVDAQTPVTAAEGASVEDVRNFGVEGEKERTVAKAALSVAELGVDQRFVLHLSC